jgi:hypothetical protein
MDVWNMSPAALIFQFFILWMPRAIVWTFQQDSKRKKARTR